MTTLVRILFWTIIPGLLLLLGIHKIRELYPDTDLSPYVHVVVSIMMIAGAIFLWTVSALKYRAFLKGKAREMIMIRIPLLVYSIINGFFSKDTIFLFDSFYDQNAECIDSYSLFMFLKTKNIKCKYLLWDQNVLFEKIRYENLDDIIVLNKNNPQLHFFLKSFFTLLKTKIIITSFGGMHQILIDYFYSKKDILHVHIGHGKTFLKTSVFLSDYLSPNKYNKFVVASDMEREIFINHGWKGKNIIKVGLPRWDLLHEKQDRGKKKTIFIMFTWRKTFKTSTMKKLKQAGFTISSSEYVKKINSLISSERLGSIISKNNMEVFFALHHSLYKQVKEFPHISGINLVLPTSISSYVNTSDMLITDYSSIAFDFMFMNKPVIFYRLDDSDKNLMSLDHFDFNNAKEKDKFLFNVVYDEDSVCEIIQKYINSNFIIEENFKQLSNNFFTHKTNIREKLIQKINEHYKDYIS